MAQQPARVPFGLAVVGDGAHAVDEDRVVAGGLLDAAPLAAGQVLDDLVGSDAEASRVVHDDVGRTAEAGLTNVRLCGVDAVWLLEHLVAPGSLEELWTFFPDPWHKTKHHKRRLVVPAFAAVAAARLRPGAVWRLATDWAAYAEQMVEVLDAEPLLAGGVVERWEGRPLTRFERKGLAAGRAVTDLAYVRRA